MWQSSLAACGYVGVATRAGGVLFVTGRARAVAAWRVPTEPVECYQATAAYVSEPVCISTCSL